MCSLLQAGLEHRAEQIFTELGYETGKQVDKHMFASMLQRLQVEKEEEEEQQQQTPTVVDASQSSWGVWDLLEASCALTGANWVQLGANVSPTWPQFGLNLAHLGSNLALMWPQLKQFLV